MEKNIGLIAGNGNLPIVITKAAKSQGYRVYICAINGEASESLSNIADNVEWVALGQLSKLAKFFKRFHVSNVMMAGKVTKTNLFKGEVKPDLEMVKLIAKIRDRKDDTLLGAVTNYLESNGIHVLSSVSFLSAELPEKGILTKQKPNNEDYEEIEFGWKIAKQIAGLDIGQIVVTKKKAVIAVEAIEGTDRAILRASELASKGTNVFKVAKPSQDMRFDVPTVGLTTLDSMIRAGVRMLVIEAKKTILLDREEFFKKANQQKMIVVAWEDDGKKGR